MVIIDLLYSARTVGSLSSEDHDFDPTADMLVHEYDDERTLEEEESLEGEKNFSTELADLEKEGNMPLEDLLAMYRYEASVSTAAASSVDSSSGELTDDLPDMTLDKEEIAKDLLSGDYEEETQSSADDLTPSVTSHEATDFFPRTLRCESRVKMWVCVWVAGFVVFEEADQLLWAPGVLSEKKVEVYLKEALSQSADNTTCGRRIRDNEQALYELVKCNYNTNEALAQYCTNLKSSKEESPAWSEEECRNFEHALQVYEKNFHLIQKNKVPTRTVAECVSFYYIWKKSERFDHFVQQNRFGKKKYSIYPGVTDLMDRLVDEAEGLAMDTSSSVCLGGGGGRIEVSAEQQLGLLNTITASDLTALSNSVASVCGPADMTCIESSYFPPLGHDEGLGYTVGGGLGVLDSAFYRSELGQLALCGSKDCERPSKRLKTSLSDSFIGDVAVANLGADFESRRAHRITGAKMAVSVTDFGGMAASGEVNGFISSHSRQHQQHTALQSE
uniref:Mesoderm induction early response 1, family member 3 b n=1 Tax=Electrophorus electricus TaxID=8005 RepID=A0AAY5F0J7_ELEEL